METKLVNLDNLPNPRDISKIKSGEYAYDVCRSIQSRLDRNNAKYTYILAKMLHNVRKKKLYRSMFKTFKAFCEEVGYGERYCHNLARVGGIFNEDHFAKYGVRKLIFANRWIKDREEALQFLEAHNDLTAVQFEQEVKSLFMEGYTDAEMERARTKVKSNACLMSPKPKFVPWADFSTKASYGVLELGGNKIQLVFDNRVIYGRLIKRS